MRSRRDHATGRRSGPVEGRRPRKDDDLSVTFVYDADADVEAGVDALLFLLGRSRRRDPADAADTNTDADAADRPAAPVPPDPIGEQAPLTKRP